MPLKAVKYSCAFVLGHNKGERARVAEKCLRCDGKGFKFHWFKMGFIWRCPRCRGVGEKKSDE